MNWIIIKVLNHKIKKTQLKMEVETNTIVKKAFNHKIDVLKSAVLFLKSE